MMEPARFRPLHAPPPRIHIDSSSRLSITGRCRQWCRPTRTPSTGTWTWGEATLHTKDTISSLKEDP